MKTGCPAPTRRSPMARVLDMVYTLPSSDLLSANTTYQMKCFRRFYADHTAPAARDGAQCFRRTGMGKWTGFAFVGLHGSDFDLQAITDIDKDIGLKWSVIFLECPLC